MAPKQQRTSDMGSRATAGRKAASATVRLGRIVVESGLVSEADLERALQMQAETGERLGNILVVLELLSEEDLIDLLSRAWATAFQYSTASGSYSLESYASDAADGPAPPTPWINDPYDIDLELTNGQFTQAPTGQ